MFFYALSHVDVSDKQHSVGAKEWHQCANSGIEDGVVNSQLDSSCHVFWNVTCSRSYFFPCTFVCVKIHGSSGVGHSMAGWCRHFLFLALCSFLSVVLMSVRLLCVASECVLVSQNS